MIETDTRTLLGHVRDLERPVPTCGDWTMDDLLRHVGRIHRWAAHIVWEGITEPERQPEVPADLDSPVAWVREGAELVLGALRRAAPEDQVWGWAGQHTVAFWRRRIAQETLMHRVDAQLAAGADPRIDPTVAADGLDELLTVLLAGERMATRMAGEGETLHVHRTDGEGEWLLRMAPEGLVVTPEHAKGDAAVRGPARDLLLCLWGRVGDHGLAQHQLEVHGDAAVLDVWAERFPM